MADLDLTPDAVDKASQTASTYLSSPAVRTAIQKLQESADALPRALRSITLAELGASATPCLDVVRQFVEQNEQALASVRALTKTMTAIDFLAGVRAEANKSLAVLERRSALYSVAEMAVPVLIPPHPCRSEERRIEHLEDDIAELKERVRGAETRALKAELRLAQALPPLWTGEPPEDSSLN